MGFRLFYVRPEQNCVKTCNQVLLLDLGLHHGIYYSMVETVKVIYNAIPEKPRNTKVGFTGHS